ncbi:unnamed protein product [Echinostoma caproni]|uniref:DUF4042 domain-containing protein n=1 Tax=Echinostoma caproni TaxID=27848 RepID=A0A183AIM1_9TREM|nr:unnamed protein product [Echinostoma caproni]
MQLLPVLLTQTMKYLPQAVEDPIRLALVVTLGQYCDSALEYLSINDDSPATWDTIVELLSPHTCAAVELILNSWLSNTKDMMLLTAVYANVGSFASLTETKYLISELPKVLSCLIVQWRRAASLAMELALCQSLNTFVSTVIRRSHASSPISSPTRSENPVTSPRPGDSGFILSRLSTSSKLQNQSAPTDLQSIFASEIDGLLTCLFHHLFLIAQRQASSDNPVTVATHTKLMNEITRAFATLCSSYPDRVWLAVQPHLTSGPELSRTITLDLLRHLVSTGSSPDRSPFSMTTRQQIVNTMLRLLFGSGVSLSGSQQLHTGNALSSPASMNTGLTTNVLNRRSLRHSLMGDVVHGAPLGPNRDSLLLGEIAAGEHVSPLIRVELIKLILTVGSLGYLDLEGGHILIEFVIRQYAATSGSSVPNEKTSRSNPSPREIRNLCVHVMKLSSSTVSAMRSVLWPFLLEFLMPIDCTEAIGVVCDSIANILAKPPTDSNCLRSNSVMHQSVNNDLGKIDGSDQDVETTEHNPGTAISQHKNLPSSHKLFARLVVLLGVPINGGNRGLPILRVMLALAKQIHPTLPMLWNLVLPRMILYLSRMWFIFTL